MRMQDHGGGKPREPVLGVELFFIGLGLGVENFHWTGIRSHISSEEGMQLRSKNAVGETRGCRGGACRRSRRDALLGEETSPARLGTSCWLKIM
jgi:hypothetical protein